VPMIDTTSKKRKNNHASAPPNRAGLAVPLLPGRNIFLSRYSIQPRFADVVHSPCNVQLAH